MVRHTCVAFLLQPTQLRETNWITPHTHFLRPFHVAEHSSPSANFSYSLSFGLTSNSSPHCCKFFMMPCCGHKQKVASGFQLWPQHLHVPSRVSYLASVSPLYSENEHCIRNMKQSLVPSICKCSGNRVLAIYIHGLQILITIRVT